MPNNIGNIIDIPYNDNNWEEKSKEFKKIIKLMKSKKSDFDFNNVIKYPENFEKLDKEYHKAKEKMEKLPREKQNWQNLPKDGYNNGGYDWCCDNWGTKWNAYETSNNYDDCISFQTAWSTPLPIFLEISKKLPSIKFRVRYADEDIGSNAGILWIKGGEVIREINKSGCNLWCKYITTLVERDYYYKEYYNKK